MKIRPAHVDEAEALTELVMRSKAHWGYDADFLARCRPVLRVTPERIATGNVFVAEESHVPLGVLAIGPAPNRFDVHLLFIAPEAIGRGVGRLLWEKAARRASADGHREMFVISDPFAEGFYLRLGAVRVGEHESEIDPARKLPLLRYRIGSAIESPSLPAKRAERG